LCVRHRGVRASALPPGCGPAWSVVYTRRRQKAGGRLVINLRSLENAFVGSALPGRRRASARRAGWKAGGRPEGLPPRTLSSVLVARRAMRTLPYGSRPGNSHRTLPSYNFPLILGGKLTVPRPVTAPARDSLGRLCAPTSPGGSCTGALRPSSQNSAPRRLSGESVFLFGSGYARLGAEVLGASSMEVVTGTVLPPRAESPPRPPHRSARKRMPAPRPVASIPHERHGTRGRTPIPR